MAKKTQKTEGVGGLGEAGTPSVDEHGQIRLDEVGHLARENRLKPWITEVLSGRLRVTGGSRNETPHDFLTRIFRQLGGLDRDCFQDSLLDLLKKMNSAPSGLWSGVAGDELLQTVRGVFRDTYRQQQPGRHLRRMVESDLFITSFRPDLHWRLLQTLTGLGCRHEPSFWRANHRQDTVSYARVIISGLSQFSLEEALKWIEEAGQNDQVFSAFLSLLPGLAKKNGVDQIRPWIRRYRELLPSTAQKKRLHSWAQTLEIIVSADVWATEIDLILADNSKQSPWEDGAESLRDVLARRVGDDRLDASVFQEALEKTWKHWSGPEGTWGSFYAERLVSMLDEAPSAVALNSIISKIDRAIQPALQGDWELEELIGICLRGLRQLLESPPQIMSRRAINSKRRAHAELLERLLDTQPWYGLALTEACLCRQARVLKRAMLKALRPEAYSDRSRGAKKTIRLISKNMSQSDFTEMIVLVIEEVESDVKEFDKKAPKLLIESADQEAEKYEVDPRGMRLVKAMARLDAKVNAVDLDGLKEKVQNRDHLVNRVRKSLDDGRATWVH